VAFEAIPNAWRVSLIYHAITSNLEMVNTFGVRDGGAHTIEAANTVAGIFATWFSAHQRALVTNKTRLDQIDVLDLASETGISLVYTTGLPLVGSGDNTPVTVNASPIVTFHSDGRGRASRGRNYIVGCSALNWTTGDGDELLNTAQAAYQASYEALGSAIAAEDMDHAILSRSTLTAIPITSYQVRTYVGTQRRRAIAP
jgi:hypothetical protein